MDGLNEVYSRTANCAAAFFSHYSLWKKCVEDNETFAIFEHDAVLNNKIPEAHFDYVMNLGHPSYGKWNTPSTLGVNPLTSKRYFPGAHAYMVKPEGAKKLIEQAKICARPTDVFMNLDDMPWLQEYYPWPAMAKDEFTTIQKQAGTTAKHNKVKIINAV
jgi:GR25 family glycosyltransferase involved in LPS biosynthesis